MNGNALTELVNSMEINGIQILNEIYCRGLSICYKKKFKLTVINVHEILLTSSFYGV